MRESVIARTAWSLLHIWFARHEAEVVALRLELSDGVNETNVAAENEALQRDIEAQVARNQEITATNTALVAQIREVQQENKRHLETVQQLQLEAEEREENQNEELVQKVGVF